MEGTNYIRKKLELLSKLNKYKYEGYILSKNYSINSSIYDLEFELDLIKKKIQEEEKDLIFKSFLNLSENFKDYFDKTKETSEENSETTNYKDLEEKKEILKKLQDLRDEGYHVEDLYTLDNNVEDLRLRLKRATKLHKEGLLPDDYESESIFKTYNFDDYEKLEKNTDLIITETANTIHNNLSKEFTGNKKIMQKVTENFIDGFTNKFIDLKLIDEKNKHKTTNLLKVLSTMLISNNKTLDLY